MTRERKREKERKTTEGRYIHTYNLRSRSRTVSSATLVCRSIVSPSTSSLFLLLSHPPLCSPPLRPSLRDQRVVSMIPSSGDEDEGGREEGTPRHPLFSTVASFRDVSIDFISCGCINARCGRVLKPARETGTSRRRSGFEMRLGFTRCVADIRIACAIIWLSSVQRRFTQAGSLLRYLRRILLQRDRVFPRSLAERINSFSSKFNTLLILESRPILGHEK